jgi:hypothetical protein
VRSAAGIGQSAILPASVANPFLLTPLLTGLDGVYSVIFPPTLVTGMEFGGSSKLTVSKTGSFTGSLSLLGISYSFKGQFDPVTGMANATVTRKPPLSTLQFTLSLGLLTDDRAQILGSITDGSNTVTATGTQHRWPGTLGILSLVQGKTQLYNLVFEPGAGFADALYPQGSGYAAIKVDAKGSATVIGKLADGSPFTFAGFIGPSTELPLLVPLYTKRGYLSGILQISTGVDPGSIADNTVTGSFTWSRNDVTVTKPTEKLYPEGFLMTLDALGGAYIAPPSGYRVLELGSGASHTPINIQIIEMFPPPPTLLSRAVTISKTNICSINNLLSPENAIKLKVVASTGFFSGSFVKLAPKRTVSYSGLLLPSLPPSTAAGYGFFLMPGPTSTSRTLSGHVSLTP